MVRPKLTRRKNDGNDDSEVDEWSSSDEEDLPVVDNPVDPHNIKVCQLSIIL